MTTVATDGDTMAADGLLVSGGTVFGTNFEKIRSLKSGAIVGIAGTASYFEPFCDWICNGGDMPEFDENFEAIVLYPDGICRSFDHKGRSIIEELPTASGSGREIALGAMAVGASPEEAVKAACQRDTQTGGTVRVLARPKRRLRRVA